jgi:hypothetical protein
LAVVKTALCRHASAGICNPPYALMGKSPSCSGWRDVFSPQDKKTGRQISSHLCLDRLYQPSGVHLIGEFGLRGSHWM